MKLPPYDTRRIRVREGDQAPANTPVDLETIDNPAWSRFRRLVLDPFLVDPNSELDFKDPNSTINVLNSIDDYHRIAAQLEAIDTYRKWIGRKK